MLLQYSSMCVRISGKKCVRSQFTDKYPQRLKLAGKNVVQLTLFDAKIKLVQYLLADLKNQPTVSSCVTHILPFCGYFKGQEEICFNPTSWHLVTYTFYEVINFDR